MKHTSLGVFRFDSTGAGLRALNTLDLSPQLNLIEASGLGRRGFWILLQGETESLKNLCLGAGEESASVESAVIGKVDQRLIDAIYALYSGEASGELIVCESDDVAPLLEYCNQALALGLNLVEVKIDRGARGKHLALLSGAGLKSKLSVVSAVALKLTHIGPIGTTLKKYLGPEGIA